MKKRILFQTVLTEELKHRLQEIAKSKGVSMNAIIRIALSEYLQRTAWVVYYAYKKRLRNVV